MKGTLSCTATGCVNNMSGICSANNINITGSKAHTTHETQCHTFSEKGLKNSIENVLNMNVIGEIKQAFKNDKIEMSPNIKCVAINCLHNSKEDCKAKNIMVNGIGAVSSTKTECETFKEK